MAACTAVPGAITMAISTTLRAVVRPMAHLPGRGVQPAGEVFKRLRHGSGMHHRHRARNSPGLRPAVKVAWHDVEKGDMQATRRAGRYLNVFASAAAPRPPVAPLRRRGNCASRGGSARAATILPVTAYPTMLPQIPRPESRSADAPVYPPTWGGRASFLGMRSGGDSGSNRAQPQIALPCEALRATRTRREDVSVVVDSTHDEM